MKKPLREKPNVIFFLCILCYNIGRRKRVPFDKTHNAALRNSNLTLWDFWYTVTSFHGLLWEFWCRYCRFVFKKKQICQYNACGMSIIFTPPSIISSMQLQFYCGFWYGYDNWIKYHNSYNSYIMEWRVFIVVNYVNSQMLF